MVKKQECAEGQEDGVQSQDGRGVLFRTKSGDQWPAADTQQRKLILWQQTLTCLSCQPFAPFSCLWKRIRLIHRISYVKVQGLAEDQANDG